LARAGYNFRRWRYLQAMAARVSRPSYDLVELRRNDPSGFSWTWTQYDIARLRREGVDWVVVQEHPYLKFSAVDAPFVETLADHSVKTFNPFTAAATPLYDPIDAYYLPVAGFAGVDRAGPKITIYRLGTP